MTLTATELSDVALTTITSEVVDAVNALQRAGSVAWIGRAVINIYINRSIPRFLQLRDYWCCTWKSRQQSAVKVDYVGVLPVSQFSPVKPSAHEHVNPGNSCVQFAPF